MNQSANFGQIVWIIYGIILLYFLLGGIGFYIINRKKSTEIARKSYVKYFTYVVIIHVVFFAIVLQPFIFRFIVLLVVCIGTVELMRLFKESGFQNRVFFVVSLACYFIFVCGFYMYSGLDTGLILYGFLVTSIFDSFSQITGQIWGKRKLIPDISPLKTTEGLIGGTIIAILSGYMLSDLLPSFVQDELILTFGIVIFAFLGDIMASYYKRKFQVKDFSRLIPGHGGVLDRFDSLISSGAWIVFYFYFL